MDAEEIVEAAIELVADYLAEGIEYIAIAEYVGDEFDGDDDDIEAVALEVRAVLNRIGLGGLY